MTIALQLSILIALLSLPVNAFPCDPSLVGKSFYVYANFYPPYFEKIRKGDTFDVIGIDGPNYLLGNERIQGRIHCEGLERECGDTIIDTEKYKVYTSRLNTEIWVPEAALGSFEERGVGRPTTPQSLTIKNMNIRGSLVEAYFEYELSDGTGISYFMNVEKLEALISKSAVLLNKNEIEVAREKQLAVEEQAQQQARRYAEVQENLKKEEERVLRLIRDEAIAKDFAKEAKHLKSNGISKGTTLWTKRPLSGYPGAKKFIVKSISPVPYDGISTAFKIGITISSSQATDELTFVSVDEIVNAFYIKNEPAKWSKAVLKTINEGNVRLGMNTKQVIAGWGNPEDINRTVGAWGVHEQWVYGSSYLYFENGILTTFQD